MSEVDGRGRLWLEVGRLKISAMSVSLMPAMAATVLGGGREEVVAQAEVG